jgi:hypothetical protein
MLKYYSVVTFFYKKMINKTTFVMAIFAIVTIVAAVGLAATLVTSNLAHAVNTSCNNGGGNEPPGQQPTCKGKGLTQNTIP